MRDHHCPETPYAESAICESEIGFEILDMLAQANIDFRRLPAEELQSLMAYQNRKRSPAPKQKTPRPTPCRNRDTKLMF